MNENPNVEVKQLQPITKFIYTIGVLPTSYLMSMTYQEQLTWLCNYISQTLIPSINTDGEAIQELQELYKDLQNYVNNYFDNLDVQEEINNKLDDMVDSGELEEIIALYLSTNAIIGFDTVADMKNSENLVNGSFVRTLGFYSKNDGGSSLYKVRTITNDDVVDEKTIIALDDDSLIAELIFDKEMNIEQFGVIGDGTTDDYASFQCALNHGGIINLGKGKSYKISDYLRLKDTTTINLNGSTLITTLNRIFYNFLTSDEFTDYNGNGNIIIKNGNINGGCISLIHGENILIENVNFKDTLNNHFIELCACKNVKIDNCTFLNTLDATNKGCINLDPCEYTSFPWLDEENPTYDDTVNDNIIICNCKFDGIMRGVDAHAETENHNTNISIYNNDINATNTTENCDAIQLFACDNVKAFGNKIKCYRYGFFIYGDNVSIFNNTIISTRTAKSPPVYVYKSSANLYLKDNKGYTNTSDRMYNSVVINPNDANMVVNFIAVDPFTNIASNQAPDGNGNIEKDISYNITDFNKLIIMTGYTTGGSAGSYKITELKPYFQNNFQTSEYYNLDTIKSGCKLHIVSATKIRFEGIDISVRTVMFAKD